MRNKWVLILVVMALAFGIAYFGSPYLAARNLKQAVKEGDADKIEAGIDFTSVKVSLKSQLSLAFMRKMNSDPDTQGNAFAALGALIVPAFVDKAIDAYVTPEGLAALMQGRKPGGTQLDQSIKTPEYISDEEFLSLDRFRVNVRDKQSGKQGPSLLFERRGFFAWKLVKIELPTNLFETPGEVSGPALMPNASGTNEARPTETPTGMSGIAAPIPEAEDQSATTAHMTEYNFDDFPSGSYSGPWVAPNFAGDQRQFRQFRTMISDGAKQGPVFSRSVAISLFGCGTECSMGYAIDLKSGTVFQLPFGGEANSDLVTEYHVESRLLKAAWKGALVSYPGDITACAGFAYFEWTGHGFRTLKASPHSPVCE